MVQYISNKPSNKKIGQWLTLEWDSKWISGERWSRPSVLPPDMGMKIVAWQWIKGCWLSIHNKVKTEQSFTVRSANRIAVFQASLKVVREEADPNSPTKITNGQHPRDQNVYEKEDAVNKNDNEFWNDRMIRSLVKKRLQKGRNSRMIYTNCTPGQANLGMNPHQIYL